jgi:hypothetical protein
MSNAQRRRTNRRAMRRPGRPSVGCAWLDCPASPAATVAGLAYCRQHKDWAAASAAHFPGMSPPWLPTKLRLPELWAGATPAARARMEAGQRLGLAAMEREGLARVFGALDHAATPGYDA